MFIFADKGDPLMPALFSLGQHSAMIEVAAELREGEHLFAYLDDAYLVCQPDRVTVLFRAFRRALWQHAHIRVHEGKTRVWNQAGVEPAGLTTALLEEGEGDGAEELAEGGGHATEQATEAAAEARAEVMEQLRRKVWVGDPGQGETAQD